jgi:hypothetical protein
MRARRRCRRSRSLAHRPWGRRRSSHVLAAGGAYLGALASRRQPETLESTETARAAARSESRGSETQSPTRIVSFHGREERRRCRRDAGIGASLERRGRLGGHRRHVTSRLACDFCDSSFPTACGGPIQSAKRRRGKADQGRGERAGRTPRKRSARPGASQRRYAERQSLAKSIQEPPRKTRKTEPPRETGFRTLAPGFP